MKSSEIFLRIAVTITLFGAVSLPTVGCASKAKRAGRTAAGAAVQGVQRSADVTVRGAQAAGSAAAGALQNRRTAE